jgi:hypothetical protein
LLIVLKIFSTKQQIKAVEELSLTANQKRSEMSALKWRIENEPATDHRNIVRGRGLAGDGFLVELQPMELRTFSVVFQ